MANVSSTNDITQRYVKAFRLSTAVLFSVACLACGMMAAAIGYVVGTVPDAGVRHPPIYPKDWMFWAIWFVLYPTMGVAAYQLWRARSGLGWRLFLLGYAVNLTWVPIVHLTHSPVAAPAVMDAVAGTAFLPGAWVIARSNRPAFQWCLPVLVWGVITGILKIWQLEINRNLFPQSEWDILQWAIYAGAAGMIVQVVVLFRGFNNRVPLG